MNVFAKFGLAVAGSMVVVTTVMAQGAPDPNAAAVAARKGVFQALSLANGPASAQLRPGAPAPDGAAIVKAAQRVAVLGSLITDAFAKDTHGVAGLTTRAQDAIWTTNKADFDAKTADLVKAAGALEAAGKSGDAAAIKKAAGDVGKSCGACHDQFRAK